MYVALNAAINDAPHPCLNADYFLKETSTSHKQIVGAVLTKVIDIWQDRILNTPLFDYILLLGTISKFYEKISYNESIRCYQLSV